MKNKEDKQRFSLTADQKNLARSIWENDVTVCYGSAGTGKTATTLQTFLDLMAHKHIDKIVCVRLITDTFDEHLGALPGSQDEKLTPFLGPMLDNLQQLLKPGELEYDLKNGKIIVIPVSHVRGRTFYRSGVIVDEAQNMTNEMILTIATRIGEGARMVFCGDPDQSDFRGRNGIRYATKLFEGIESAGTVYLSDENICRHPIIPDILKNARKLKERHEAA
jgi:phosphate starvation-inducible protein PhoH